ncbi:hypothetical protein LZK80_33160 (plasmid) [Rhizobium leguminosarum]|nr:hypothetical protein LZK80_33160 [Rhizobium leguminosarum]
MSAQINSLPDRLILDHPSNFLLARRALRWGRGRDNASHAVGRAIPGAPEPWPGATQSVVPPEVPFSFRVSDS